MKRRISILLSLIMALSLVPMSVFASETIQSVVILGIDEPVDGAPYDRFASLPSNAKYTIFNEPKWYDETDKRYLEEGDSFESGHIYTVSVWLEPGRGYEFASTVTTTDVKASINGKSAKADKAYEYQRWAMVAVSYTFPAVEKAKPVGEVIIEIAKPKPGEKVSFDAKLTGEGVKLMERIPDLPVRESYDIDGGVKTYNSGEDSPKVIESTEIVSFECEFSLIAAVLEEESELSGRIYTLDAEPDGGTVKCKIDWYGRESSSVPREFMADASFMKKIQTIAEKYDFAQHNGYESVVSGLPHMYGAKLDIKYASGESIYAYDNQDCFISLDATNELVELFSSYTMEYSKVSENDPEKPIEPENPQTTEKPAETDTPTQTEKPQETPMMSFVDVVKGQYCYDAVMWAANEGITGGTSATTFSPEDSCTRGQVVTFLYRFINEQ